MEIQILKQSELHHQTGRALVCVNFYYENAADKKIIFFNVFVEPTSHLESQVEISDNFTCDTYDTRPLCIFNTEKLFGCVMAILGKAEWIGAHGIELQHNGLDKLEFSYLKQEYGYYIRNPQDYSDCYANDWIHVEPVRASSTINIAYPGGILTEFEYGEWCVPGELKRRVIGVAIVEMKFLPGLELKGFKNEMKNIDTAYRYDYVSDNEGNRRTEEPNPEAIYIKQSSTMNFLQAKWP